jgi:hypothetical protein
LYLPAARARAPSHAIQLSLDEPIIAADEQVARLGSPSAMAGLLLGRDISRQGPIKLTLLAVLVYGSSR